MQQLPQEFFTPSLLLHGMESVIGVVIAAIGWRIKAEVSKALAQMKLSSAELEARLIKGQTEMRLDMDRKHAENREAVVGHVAEDKANFQAIGRTLQRIDDTLVRLDERSR